MPHVNFTKFTTYKNKNEPIMLGTLGVCFDFILDTYNNFTSTICWPPICRSAAVHYAGRLIKIEISNSATFIKLYFPLSKFIDIKFKQSNAYAKHGKSIRMTLYLDENV